MRPVTAAQLNLLGFELNGIRREQTKLSTSRADFGALRASETIFIAAASAGWSPFSLPYLVEE